MLKISIVKTPKNNTFSTKYKLLKKLPESYSERANRYLDLDSSISFLTGRLLLKNALTENKILISQLEKIHFTKYGKPKLKGCHFSVSHSNGYVVLAFSTDISIGIDIEKKKNIDLKLFKYLFIELEWESIIEAENSLERFYWFWVRKEALLKTVGCTLKDLKQLEVFENHGIYQGKRYYIDTFKFDPDFNGVIAMEEKVGFDVEVIDFVDLVTG